MASGFLVSAVVCFIISALSFIVGTYNVDRYVQLLSLTTQQSPFAKATVRIGMYLFIVPALFTFFGMKLLQIHLAAQGKEVATRTITEEIFRQTGGVTLFSLSLGILLVIYAQVLIRSGLRNKVLVYVPGILCFVAGLTYLADTLVISLMLGCVTTLGLVIVTYRKPQNHNLQNAPGSGRP